LQDAGASVKAFEPFAPNAKLPNLTTVPALNEALEDADAVILLVAHSQFKSLDATEISEIMNGYVAVDVVNGWNVSVWKNAGFDILRLGVGG
ncbi:MAG: UDP-N-acetyl-D-mannosamine dehydrogenase, partial [Anaerolineae bacterium]|nr:UDP-N-acetyl-D-mannosamine dehydrogenase [Anaerolineae bacterium]